MTLLSIMFACLSQLGAKASFWTLLPGLAVGGVGMAMSMTPTTAAAMRSVPVAKAGVGSAVLSSMRQVGGSLGIAVIGAIVAAGHLRVAPPRRSVEDRPPARVSRRSQGRRFARARRRDRGPGRNPHNARPR
jgi:hypothetical protein